MKYAVLNLYCHILPPLKKKRTAYVIRITLQREVNNTIEKWAAISME